MTIKCAGDYASVHAWMWLLLMYGVRIFAVISCILYE